MFLILGVLSLRAQIVYLFSIFLLKNFDNILVPKILAPPPDRNPESAPGAHGVLFPSGESLDCPCGALYIKGATFTLLLTVPSSPSVPPHLLTPLFSPQPVQFPFLLPLLFSFLPPFFLQKVPGKQVFGSGFWPKRPGSGALYLKRREIFKILMNKYFRYF